MHLELNEQLDGVWDVPENQPARIWRHPDREREHVLRSGGKREHKLRTKTAADDPRGSGGGVRSRLNDAGFAGVVAGRDCRND